MHRVSSLVERARSMSRGSLTLHGRDFAGILTSGAVNNFVALAGTAIGARRMGPDEFALFGALVAGAMLTSTIVDFGTSTSLIRRVSGEGRSARRLVILLWVLKCLLGVGLMVAALLFRESMERAYFGRLQLPVPALLLLVLAAILLSLWMTVRAGLQATNSFHSLSRLTLTYAAVRIVTLSIALREPIEPLTLFTSVYVVPLAVTVIAGMSILVLRSAQSRVRCADSWATDARALFGYGAWVAVSSIAFAFLWRLPQLNLAHAASRSELGLYTAGMTFVAFFSLLNDSLRTIVLPRTAGMADVMQRQRFRGRVWQMAPLFFLGAATAIGLLAGVQRYLLGREYSAGVWVFVVLAIATSTTMFLGLLNSLVHARGVPHWDAAANLAKLALLVLGLQLTASRALAHSVVFGIVMILGELMLYEVLRRRDAKARDAETVGC